MLPQLKTPVYKFCAFKWTFSPVWGKSKLPLYLRQLSLHIPRLRHLSLLDFRLAPDSLSHLLTTYRDCLQSLTLKDMSVTIHNGDADEHLFNCFWEALNSLPALRRLAIRGERPFFSKLETFLPKLLPRLTSLTLNDYEDDLSPLLGLLNSSKLTQLHLARKRMAPLEGFFIRKPAFGLFLTRLTLSFGRQDQSGVTLSFLEIIVSRCCRLKYLDLEMETSITFDNILPHLVKLRRLTFLGLRSQNDDLFQVTPARSALLALPSLEVLDLAICLNPQTLSILPIVCPNLRQLYLHRASLRISCSNYPVSLEMRRLYDSKMAKDLVSSVGKAQLITVLKSFPFTPTFKSGSQ